MTHIDNSTFVLKCIYPACVNIRYNNNNENFIEFFMHLQLKISLLKVIHNWLLDTLYITTFT